MEFWLRETARRLIEQALWEDAANGDCTTQALFPHPVPAEGVLLARQELILAGLEVARMVFHRVDPSLEFRAQAGDGEVLKAGDRLATLKGDGRSILTAERVAINFLQRLCAIATWTRKFVQAIEGSKAQIVDTRKTIPGWRTLEKYAVWIGGGRNHRFNLGSGLLIKDNHVDLLGSLGEAVHRARTHAPHPLRIEVEARNLEEVEQALASGAEIILLDNMDLKTLRQAVRRIGGQARVEASGGITLDNVTEVAASGVDYISVGALTHGAPSVDISLDIVRLDRPQPAGG